MQHLTKSASRQCKCIWCGDNAPTGVCPVSASIRLAVVRYALVNGPGWRGSLSRLWASGKDEGNLRNARNMIGPSGLHRITQHIIVDTEAEALLKESY